MNNETISLTVTADELDTLLVDLQRMGLSRRSVLGKLEQCVRLLREQASQQAAAAVSAKKGGAKK